MPGRGGRRDRGEVRSGTAARWLIVLFLFLAGCALVFGGACGPLVDFDLDLSGLRCIGSGILGNQRLSRVALAPDGRPPVWIASLAHVPTSPPVVAEGRVFVRTDAGELVALDAATGSTLWTVALGTPPPIGTDFAPVVDGGTVFLTDWSGVVHALDAATGASRWSTPLPADPATTTRQTAGHGDAAGVFDLAPRGGAPLTVDQESAYVDGAALVALDRDTGATRWSSPLADSATSGYSQPVLSGDTVIVGSTRSMDRPIAGVGIPSGARAVRAVDRTSGATRWEAVGDGGTGWLDTGSFAAPRLADTPAGLVVIGLRRHAVVVLDPASGNEVRRVPIDVGRVSLGSVPVTVGNLVLERAGRLTAFDPTTGAVLWGTDIGGTSSFDFAPPLVADGIVVTPGGDGRLHALDIADGRERWAIGTPRTDRCNDVTRTAPPAITETAMIALSAHRRVVALPRNDGP